MFLQKPEPVFKQRCGVCMRTVSVTNTCVPVNMHPVIFFSYEHFKYIFIGTKFPNHLVETLKPFQLFLCPFVFFEDWRKPLLNRNTETQNAQTKRAAQIVNNFIFLGGREDVWSPPISPFLFLFLMWPISASNRRRCGLAAGSNYSDPNSWGVIRETGRTIWLHDWHRLMIMGSNSTLLWSTNHTGLAWTPLNAKEPWPECWAAAQSGSSTPHHHRGSGARPWLWPFTTCSTVISVATEGQVLFKQANVIKTPRKAWTHPAVLQALLIIPVTWWMKVRKTALWSGRDFTGRQTWMQQDFIFCH